MRDISIRRRRGSSRRGCAAAGAGTLGPAAPVDGRHRRHRAGQAALPGVRFQSVTTPLLAVLPSALLSARIADGASTSPRESEALACAKQLAFRKRHALTSEAWSASGLEVHGCCARGYLLSQVHCLPVVSIFPLAVPACRCGGRLGSFNWSGMQSARGRWVVPAFQLHMSRIDTQTPLPPALAGLVRHPRTGADTAAAFRHDIIDTTPEGLWLPSPLHRHAPV